MRLGDSRDAGCVRGPLGALGGIEPAGDDHPCPRPPASRGSSPRRLSGLRTLRRDDPSGCTPPSVAVRSGSSATAATTTTTSSRSSCRWTARISIRDPGTYLYTPLPERRNAYRSVRAHFAPQLVGPEPASLGDGLFRLGPGSQATCLYWGEHGFAGELRAADGRIRAVPPPFRR